MRDEATWQAVPKPIVYNEDSTSLSHFEAAVEKQTSWGFYDNDGYQCVFSSDTPDRWSVEKTTEPDFWPMLTEIGGVGHPLPLPAGSRPGYALLVFLLLQAATRRLRARS